MDTIVDLGNFDQLDNIKQVKHMNDKEAMLEKVNRSIDNFVINVGRREKDAKILVNLWL